MDTFIDDPQPTSEGEPPYPTYEFRVKNHRWDGWEPETTRNLFWTLDGPLETAIFVKTDSPANMEARTPLHDPATGEWHPIASKSVCVPPVGSILVRVDILSDWETVWDDIHYEHSEKDDPEPTCNAEWGLLEGHASRKKLLRCCDTERPLGKDVTIVVRPAKSSSDDDDSEFVTVQDYATTVHPWLMSLRGEIIEAMNAFEELFNPLPVEEYPLIVDG